MTSQQPQQAPAVDALDAAMSSGDYVAAVAIHLRRTRPVPVDRDGVHAVICALDELGVGPAAASLYRAP